MSKIHCWEKFPGIYYAPDILQGLEEVEEKFLWSRGCHGLLKRCKIRVSEIWGWCNGRINNFWGKGKGWVTVLVKAAITKIDCMTQNNRNWYFFGSAGWEVKAPVDWVLIRGFLMVSSLGGEEKESLLASLLIEVLTSYVRALLSWPNRLSKIPPSQELGFQHRNLGGTQTLVYKVSWSRGPWVGSGRVRGTPGWQGEEGLGHRGAEWQVW